MRELLIASLCCLVLVGAADVGWSRSTRKPHASKPIAWEHHYGAKHIWHEYKGIAPSPTQTFWLVATAHAPHDTSNSIQLWEITPRGTVRRDIVIKRQHTAIRALAVLDQTHLLLIIDFVEHQPWLLKVNTETRDIFAKELGDPSRLLTIRKMLSLTHQTFLLIGDENADAFAMKIDAHGMSLWEKTFDRGKRELFVDGLVLPDGEVVLVGNSGEYDIFHAGPSQVWVGRYNPQGDLMAEVHFPGRHGSITRSTQGIYGLVYDRGDEGQQEIHIRALKTDFTTHWQAKILAVEHSLHHFKIATLPGGSFLVVGGNEHQPYLTKISPQGKEQWTFWGRDMPRAMSYDLLLAHKSVLVPSSVFTTYPIAGGSTKSTKQVRVLRISVR
jgi:hypothetical protein